jgi:hypothetical protein
VRILLLWILSIGILPFRVVLRSALNKVHSAQGFVGLLLLFFVKLVAVLRTVLAELFAILGIFHAVLLAHFVDLLGSVVGVLSCDERGAIDRRVLGGRLRIRVVPGTPAWVLGAVGVGTVLREVQLAMFWVL